MRRVIGCAVVLAVMLGWGAIVRAQENKSQPAAPSQPAAAYRLVFVFSELQNGKMVNSRSYEILAREDKWNKLRAGARLPVKTGTGEVFQYLDIGMNIDCRVQESDGYIALNITADSSNISFPEAEQSVSASHQPIIRQLRSEVNTLVSPGKPTLVSSMDDPSSKHRFQLEVTATKVK